MKIDTIGKMLAMGFGDRVLIGVLMGALDDVTPDRMYEYIKDNIPPLHWASDDDWQKYGKLAKQANAGQITKEQVISAFRKYHPDLLGVILNTPGGDEWLDTQIKEIRKKLEIE